MFGSDHLIFIGGVEGGVGGASVQIENSVTRVTVRHQSANLVMPNSYPRDGIFNQHLTAIKDFYILPRRDPVFFLDIFFRQNPVLEFSFSKNLPAPHKNQKFAPLSIAKLSHGRFQKMLASMISTRSSRYDKLSLMCIVAHSLILMMILLSATKVNNLLSNLII